MTHLVLMKFQEGYFTDACFDEINQAFVQLKQALPAEILDANVYKNIITRNTNMDILIQLHLSRFESLDIYLNHPIHQAIGAKMNPYIITRVSFDYE